MQHQSPSATNHRRPNHIYNISDLLFFFQAWKLDEKPSCFCICVTYLDLKLAPEAQTARTQVSSVRPWRSPSNCFVSVFLSWQFFGCLIRQSGWADSTCQWTEILALWTSKHHRTLNTHSRSSVTVSPVEQLFPQIHPPSHRYKNKKCLGLDFSRNIENNFHPHNLIFTSHWLLIEHCSIAILRWGIPPYTSIVDKHVYVDVYKMNYLCLIKNRYDNNVWII